MMKDDYDVFWSKSLDTFLSLIAQLTFLFPGSPAWLHEADEGVVMSLGIMDKELLDQLNCFRHNLLLII